MADYPEIEVDLTAKIAPAGEHWKELDALREQHRFFWNTYGSGYWVLTRYDDIKEASHQPDIFSNHSIVATDPEPAYRFLPSFLDPPQHIKYRRLLNWWFAPAAVQKMAPRSPGTLGRRLSRWSRPVTRTSVPRSATSTR